MESNEASNHEQSHEKMKSTKTYNHTKHKNLELNHNTRLFTSGKAAFNSLLSWKYSPLGEGKVFGEGKQHPVAGYFSTLLSAITFFA